MTVTPLLAHAGEGAGWQSLVVLAAVGLAAIALLAAAGRLRIDGFDDLVLPLATVAIASAVAPLFSEVLSDGIGWALPLGVVLLAALLLAAATPLELTLTSPLTTISLGAAVVGAVLLYGPLTEALHPEVERLPLAEDAAIEIVAPEDGARLEAGELAVTVRVTGGSLGPAGFTPTQADAADPEEAGTLDVQLDGQRQEVVYEQTCSVEQPCTTVTFPVEVPPGEHVLRVEFTRGDGAPLAPMVFDRRTITAG